jgi:predicted nucleic acid-binding protein
MTLIDTNVLVALVDERDRLRSRAMGDLSKLKGPFGILDTVLVETLFLLTEPYLRRRVRFLLERLAVRHTPIHAEWWGTIFDWLEKYARHQPNLCDAALVAAATHEKRAIWTYDAEFTKVWRTPEGKPLQLVGSIAKMRRRKPRVD